MTPREYGQQLADQEPPLSPAQIRAGALILAAARDRPTARAA